MEIRTAEAADADAVADLFLAARREMTYLREVHTEAETRDWVATTLIARREVWVAAEGGRTFAFAALDEASLEHLYVEPAAQGRGVGTRLLERAKERRPEGLELWVFQRNGRARRFYERRGFEVVRETDGAGNEEREPDALYAWRPDAEPTHARLVQPA
jgi:ribosomal protein S18 acetylase RimI-like enzyme